MRGVAFGVFGETAVSAANVEMGSARSAAASAAMNDPKIVSAGDLFMEGINQDRPAAAATKAGSSAIPMGRTPVTGISRELR
jgi:hypothetical protein